MNIEDIRRKLKEAQGTKPQKLIWKPKGEHTVRMLALPGEDDITRTANWHYSVDDGRKMYCPSTDGDACPFCDVAQALRSWRDSDGNDKPEAQRKADFEAFKKIQSATKYYAPIIVRKTGDDVDAYEGPLWWEMTAKTREKLLEICLNEDYNEDHVDGGGSRILTSTKKGLDLIVTLKKANTEGNKTSYDLTQVDERRKFSPLFKNKGEKDVKELLEGVPALTDAFKVVTTAEAEKIFANWEAQLTKEGAAQVDDKAGLERGSNGNAEGPLKGEKSVEDILAKLDSMLPQDQA